MSHPPVAALESLASAPGATLVEEEEHFELLVNRGSILVVVTVPKQVLEWFVDASDEESSLKVSDWCDYAGYDGTPNDQLAAEMAGDIAAFGRSLLSRPLRFADRRGPLTRAAILEWQVDGGWEQAVPFTDKFPA